MTTISKPPLHVNRITPVGETTAATDDARTESVDGVDPSTTNKRTLDEPAPLPEASEAQLAELYGNETKAQFVARMKDRSFDANHRDLAAADLNGDGAVRGLQELGALFDVIDKRDGKKSGRIAKNAMEGAPQKDPVYNSEDLATGRDLMRWAGVWWDIVDKVGGEERDGITLGPKSEKLHLSAIRSGPKANVFFDPDRVDAKRPESGFFKQINDGPIVPMTRDEVKALIAGAKERES